MKIHRYLDSALSESRTGHDRFQVQYDLGIIFCSQYMTKVFNKLFSK